MIGLAQALPQTLREYFANAKRGNYPARIRTSTSRTKTCCATITLPGNGGDPTCSVRQLHSRNRPEFGAICGSTSRSDWTRLHRGFVPRLKHPTACGMPSDRRRFRFFGLSLLDRTSLFSESGPRARRAEDYVERDSLSMRPRIDHPNWAVREQASTHPRFASPCGQFGYLIADRPVVLDIKR